MARDSAASASVAEAGGDALQRPDATDIGERRHQRDDALGAAQRGGKPLAAGLRRDGGQFPQGGGNEGVRPRGDEATQAGGFAHRQVGEIGAVAAEAAQQRGHRRARGEPRLGAAEPGKAFDQPLRRRGVVRVRPVGGQSERRVMHARGSWR